MDRNNGPKNYAPPPVPDQERREKQGHNEKKRKRKKNPPPPPVKITSFNIPRSEWEKLIDEWIIGDHAERDRRILKLRLLDGICFEPLAEMIDLSVRQTKEIVKVRKGQLFSHLDIPIL